MKWQTQPSETQPDGDHIPLSPGGLLLCGLTTPRKRRQRRGKRLEAEISWCDGKLWLVKGCLIVLHREVLVDNDCCRSYRQKLWNNSGRCHSDRNQRIWLQERWISVQLWILSKFRSFFFRWKKTVGDFGRFCVELVLGVTGSCFPHFHFLLSLFLLCFSHVYIASWGRIKRMAKI